MDDLILDIEAISKKLGEEPLTVAMWIRSGYLPAVYSEVEKKYLMHPLVLDSWINGRELKDNIYAKADRWHIEINKFEDNNKIV